MLILTSDGLTSEKLLKRTGELISGAETAVIITTASVGYKENDKNIPRITNELNSLGLSVGCFDFDTQKAEELLKYDVIEINGGNPFYLLKTIKDKRLEPFMARLAEKKPIIGISAGSLIMQGSLELINRYTPLLNNKTKLTDLTALGLVDFETLPHRGRYMLKFENFEERAREYERETGKTVITLDDGEGAAVADGSAEIIRK